MILIKALLVTILVVVLVSTISTGAHVKKVYSGDVVWGEEPHYSAIENALYWVDISGQKVYRMDDKTGNVTSRQIGYGPLSVVISVKDYPKYLVVGVRAELYLLNWDASPGDNALRLLSAVDVGLPDNKINDGKADAYGRLWFGTISKVVNDNVTETDQATLYMIDEYNYNNPEVKVRPVSISNGIAYSLNNKLMYYIDSLTRKVEVFDYDLETGTIKNRRTVFSFDAYNLTGIPDGMTIDTDGNLWVANFLGGKVLQINPRNGKLLKKYFINASRVTSVMWGGANLSTLYVTTSREGLTASELATQPDAGSLFAIEGTGSKGLPENQFVFSDAPSY